MPNPTNDQHSTATIQNPDRAGPAAKIDNSPLFDPWNVPAFDVGKNPNETIFQNSERPVDSLLTEAQQSGKNKINRKDVPLTTERAFFHEVIVELVTTMEIKDEAALKSLVENIKNSPEYQQALQHADKGNLASVARDLVAHHPASENLPKLQTYSVPDRQAMVMMGGSGSGKSTIRRALILDMQSQGVDPGVIIDADAYKDLLGDKEKMGLAFADLTHQESSLLVDKIKTRLDKMIETDGKAPNVIIDKTAATPAHLEELAKTAGKVEVHCTYLPAEEAVVRCGQRTQVEKRAVPTKMVLEIHKEVSLGLSKLLADPNVEITIYDTNVSRGTVPPILLEKSRGSTDLVIYDVEKYASLVNQQEINSKAKGPDQLYSEGAKKPVSEIMQALVESGQTITLKKPGTNETLAEIRDKKLIIADERAFREIVGSAETDKLIAKHSGHAETPNQGVDNDQRRETQNTNNPEELGSGGERGETARSGAGGEEQRQASGDLGSGGPHPAGHPGREAESAQRRSQAAVETPSSQADGGKPKGNIDMSGKGVGLAGLATRANALKDENMGVDEKALNGMAIAADAIDTLSDTKLGKSMGWVGNALGIAADSYSGYKKGGTDEAVYQGSKSTVNTALSLGVFLDQGKNLMGKGPAATGLAGFAGEMGLINSFATAAGDAADYATGRKELTLDNANGTTLDTVVALDPLKAVTSLANATKLDRDSKCQHLFYRR